MCRLSMAAARMPERQAKQALGVMIPAVCREPGLFRRERPHSTVAPVELVERSVRSLPVPACFELRWAEWVERTVVCRRQDWPAALVGSLERVEECYLPTAPASDRSRSR